ncbi:hypothetical protein [Oleiharenicola sp. Vm1]|uniref:hypothetical protein n=1 Tax=Oleiharenicola sp. Vm1 TaxID=3398393 RepID=UPI0039F48585
MHIKSNAVLFPVGLVFLRDHADRELPTPAIVREDRRRAWLSIDDPHLDELLSDADFYADPDGPAGRENRSLSPAGLKEAAARTAAAIRRARATHEGSCHAR